VIIQAQKGKLLTIIFEQINTSGQLVPNIGPTIGKTLRDGDGAASEVVTILGQSNSGFYEAQFTPTKAADEGFPYYLRIVSPAATTDGAILTYLIQSYNTIVVSGVSGSYLTSLAAVKEYLKITGTTNDALLTSLIARVSMLIMAYCGRRFPRATYTEILDGTGEQGIVLANDPVISVASIHSSIDQSWTSPFLIDPVSYVINLGGGLVWLKYGTFAQGHQNTRVIYDAGYDAIPLDVEQIAIEMVARTFQDPAMGAISMRLKDGSISRAQSNRFYKDLQEDLGPYLRRRPAA
jgi:gp6-like head-tail connector protein